MSSLRDAMQQTWATGDFSMVGTGIVFVGELLCESVEVHAGNLVLDVATGSGNTALAAARRGCQVTGIDFVPALLDRGRERAAAERLKIEFQEGDAEAIPFPANSFDVVLSTFGAMFAPDPLRAAAEMLRVCRPGGKIGMANWTPEGMVGKMFRVTSSFAPPPPGIEPPVFWGDPDKVRERFGDSVSALNFNKREAVMRHFTPESQVEFMKQYFGPTIKAHERAGARAAELTSALLGINHEYNQAGDGTFLARAEYLEVIATKK